jgi:hypothetical protein
MEKQLLVKIYLRYFSGFVECYGITHEDVLMKSIAITLEENSWLLIPNGSELKIGCKTHFLQVISRIK